MWSAYMEKYPRDACAYVRILYGMQKRKAKRGEAKRKGRKKRLTVDPFALVADEAVDGLANVLGGADAVEGAELGEAGLDGVDVHALVAAGDVVPRVGVEHVGLDAAGGDGVAGDVLLAAVDGEGAGEALDGSLGAGVEGVVGDAGHLGGNGRGQDDAAPAAAVLEGVLGDEELAAAVEVEDLVEELRGHLGLLAPDLHARVGDDNVQVAKVLHGALEERGHLGGDRDVGLHGDRLGAHLLQGRDHLLGGRGALGVVDHDVGAALAQLHGDTPADTATGTGDQRHLAGKGLVLGVGAVHGAGGHVLGSGGGHFVLMIWRD